MDVKQRHKLANYLNVGDTAETYVLMGAGFTDLNESPSAQTSSKRYVNDKSETKRINGYDWSTAFTTDIIRDERAIDFICTIGERQLIGADAETDYVIVDLDRKVDDKFYARKFHVAIEVSDFDNNDGELTASGNLLGIGDLVEGVFDVSDNTFTPNAEVTP